MVPPEVKPSHPTPRYIYLRRMKTHVPSKTCTERPTAKDRTTSMSICWRVDKENVGYPCHRMFFGHKKEGRTVSTLRHGWILKNHGEWKKPDATDHILCDYISMKCLGHANPQRQIRGCQWLRDWKTGGMANGYTFLAGGGENVPELQSGWLHGFMSVLKKSQNCTLGRVNCTVYTMYLIKNHNPNTHNRTMLQSFKTYNATIDITYQLILIQQKKYTDIRGKVGPQWQDGHYSREKRREVEKEC